MDKKMKQFYQVPSIKVVSFKVEEGFQSQQRQNIYVGDSEGDQTAIPPVAPTQGSEDFGFGSIFRTE